MKRLALALYALLAPLVTAQDGPELSLVQGPYRSPSTLVMESYPVQFALTLTREMPTAGWELRAEVEKGADGLVARVAMIPPSGAAAQAPTAAQVRIPLGTLPAGRHVLAIESALPGEEPRLEQALLLEATGKEGEPAGGLEVVEGPFGDLETLGRRLVLSRDMPSAGWVLRVESVEGAGGRIAVEVTEVRPAGMAAQMITPTPLEIDLSAVEAGRYVLAIETRAGEKPYRMAQVVVVELD